MTRALLLTLALLLPATAAAQPDAEMPDPRSMSGMPRPEPNDPPGQITVRAIQGSIVMNAAVGTPIHLVGVGADGRARVITKPVDDQGRAVFTGLRTDGSETYYAIAVFSRQGGHDRLISAAMSLPPKVGLRVLLAGHAPDSTEPSIDELVPDGLPTPPAGEVYVSVRGQIEGVDAIKIFDLTDPSQSMSVKPEPQGELLLARFTGVPSGPTHVYMAEVVSQGLIYHSTPFMLSADRGSAASIFAWSSALFGFRGFVELDDDKLWFQVRIAIANVTGSPYHPGPDGLLIPLPRGFGAGRVAEKDQLHVGVKPGEGVVWRSALPPGQREFDITFFIPVDGGEAEIDWPMPYGAIDSQLVFQKYKGMEVSRVAEADVVDDPGQHGEPFLLVRGINRQPGTLLSVNISGLPQRPLWQRIGQVVAGVLGLGLLLTAAVILANRRRDATAVSVDAARAQATIERDQLFDQLVALEKRHRDGKAKGAAYESARAKLVAKLERTYEP